jgi:hypothetical protein
MVDQHHGTLQTLELITGLDEYISGFGDALTREGALRFGGPLPERTMEAIERLSR